MQETLKDARQQFHSDLSESVSLLSGSINDLRGYLDELGDGFARE